jgi:hypothetical protein
MNNLIAWQGPPACRDDGADQSKRAMPSAPVAVSGIRHRLEVDWTALPPAAVDPKGGSPISASADVVQRRLPETDPNQTSRASAFASDPSLVVPVIASLEEVLLARELRQQLRKRYLDRPIQPCSLWCVGID